MDQQPTLQRSIFSIGRPAYAFFKKKNKPYINEYCYHDEIDSDHVFWENYKLVYNGHWMPKRMGLTPGPKYTKDMEEAMRDPFMLIKIDQNSNKSRNYEEEEENLNEDNLKVDPNRLKTYILNNYTFFFKKSFPIKLKGLIKGQVGK